MEPVILQKSALNLVGMSFYGDPFDTRGGWDEDNHIGRTWTRFERFLEENEDCIQHVTQPGVAIELHVYHPDTLTLGHFEIFVGLQVDRLEGVPVELVIKILPPSEYAVFTLRGKEITNDWEMMIERGIAAAGYQRSYPFSFQYYDQRFKGLDRIEESVLDVYLPVKLAG